MPHPVAVLVVTTLLVPALAVLMAIAAEQVRRLWFTSRKQQRDRFN